jgi:hypothetical protein
MALRSDEEIGLWHDSDPPGRKEEKICPFSWCTS